MFFYYCGKMIKENKGILGFCYNYKYKYAFCTN